jgi:hypothetical protein
MQSAWALLYFHLRLYHIFPHYLCKDVIFGKKLLNMKCVLILSKTFIRNISHLGTIQCVPYMNRVLRLKYPLFLSDFNRTWIFSTNFNNILKYQFTWKSVHWARNCPKRLYGWAVRHDEANSGVWQFSECTSKGLKGNIITLWKLWLRIGVLWNGY